MYSITNCAYLFKPAKFLNLTNDISAVDANLKKLYFLNSYPFISNQLKDVGKKLTDFYFKESFEIANNSKAKEQYASTGNQLKWKGSFQSLSKLFGQLNTQTFLSRKGPNLVARPQEIDEFISYAFIIEMVEVEKLWILQ